MGLDYTSLWVMPGAMDAGVATSRFLPPAAPVMATLASLSLGDFTGDGVLDLVSLGPSAGATELQLFEGAIDGTLTAGASLTFGISPAPLDGWRRRLVCADLDGDGALDVATARYDSLQVIRGVADGGRGLGAFSPPVAADRYPLPNLTDPTLSAADYTGDGVLDLLVANRPVFAPELVMSLFPGQLSAGLPTGRFGSPVQVSLGMYSSTTFDVNGDGLLDVVGPAVFSTANVPTPQLSLQALLGHRTSMRDVWSRAVVPGGRVVRPFGAALPTTASGVNLPAFVGLRPYDHSPRIELSGGAQGGTDFRNELRQATLGGTVPNGLAELR